MKSSRIFWGVFFVVIGVLFLLARMDILIIPWHIAWRFWPVILVLWGVAVLVGDRPARGVITAAIAIAGGLLLLGLFSFSWLPRWEGEGWSTEKQVFQEPYDSSTQRASLTVEAAAGTYRLEEGTDKLIDAETESTFGKYSLDRTTGEGNTRLVLKMDEWTRGFHVGRKRSQCDIRLNRNPVWDLDFDIGAASANLDLSQFKVATIRLDGGAASVRLKLGANVEETRATIDVGASSLKVAVPEEAGCEVTLDSGLSSKSLHGFKSVGKGIFRTENFNAASKRIYLAIDAGVSSIKVQRY